MSSRERRIEATGRVIHRRLLDHLLLDHRHSFGHCYCEDSGPHLWSKRRIRSCGCSKRNRGAPKFGRGLCSCYDRDRVYLWRREVRELNRLARGPGFDPESDEVWLLGEPTVKKEG